MAHRLDGKWSRNARLAGAFAVAQTDIEREEIIKHKVALWRFCSTIKGSIDRTHFIYRKFHHILARDENYRELAAKFAAEPFTENEKRYMETPEYAMTPKEYYAAHPEDGSYEDKGEG